MQNNLADKSIALDEIFIHTQAKRILERIEQAHKMFKLSLDPECLFIYGTSGVGKLTLMNKLASKIEKSLTEEGINAPVLKAIVPSPTSISSLVSLLLKQLGDPIWEKGTTASKTNRLINYIRASGVEIIFLDEFNRFVDSNERNKVSQWLKFLIGTTKVAVILFGLPSSYSILKNDFLLESRFSKISLNPIQYQIT